VNAQLARLQKILDHVGVSHFRAKELLILGARSGEGPVKNSPCPKKYELNLAAAASLAERLRVAVGFPLKVISAYRSPDYNRVIGGAAGAFPPMVGWAAVTGDVSWAVLGCRLR
jgi:hypothetical protein